MLEYDIIVTLNIPLYVHMPTKILLYFDLQNYMQTKQLLYIKSLATTSSKVIYFLDYKVVVEQRLVTHTKKP